MFEFTPSILSKMTEGLIVRRFLTIMLVVAVGLRVLALVPVADVRGGSNSEDVIRSVTIHGHALPPASDCHEPTVPDQHVADNPLPSITKVCKIFCDIASAPILMAIPVSVTYLGDAILNPVENAFARGVIPPTEHPPPIAS